MSQPMKVVEVSGDTNSPPTAGQSAETDRESEQRVKAAWTHWANLGSPVTVASPMVHQSELAFRLLCRRYATQLAYTPMLHAKLFVKDATYRQQFFFSQSLGTLEDTASRSDRPLVVQFAGDNAQDLVAAAKMVRHYVDAVDVNLGCPERIAKKGHYGSFLLDEPDLVVAVVSELCAELRPLNLPVFCKIRLMQRGPHIPQHRRGLDGTIRFCQRLQAAGVAALCVHGRCRANKGPRITGADWKAIKAVKDNVLIPVIANGGIQTAEDARKCLLETGCDAVMSAEAILCNPSFFRSWNVDSAAGEVARSDKPKPTPTQLALEYLDLATQHPPGDFLKCVKPHIYRILHGLLYGPAEVSLNTSSSCDSENHSSSTKQTFLARIQGARDVAACVAVVQEMAQHEEDLVSAAAASPSNESLTVGQKTSPKTVEDMLSSWYLRHRNEVCCCLY